MSKKKLSKKECQQIHAKKRCYERYGIRLSKELKEYIIKNIQFGKSKIVVQQSERISIYDVNWNNIIFRTVFDRKRNTIVTFLDPSEPVKFNTLNFDKNYKIKTKMDRIFQNIKDDRKS